MSHKDEDFQVHAPSSSTRYENGHLKPGEPDDPATRMQGETIGQDFQVEGSAVVASAGDGAARSLGAEVAGAEVEVAAGGVEALSGVLGGVEVAAGGPGAGSGRAGSGVAGSGVAGSGVAGSGVAAGSPAEASLDELAEMALLADGDQDTEGESEAGEKLENEPWNRLDQESSEAWGAFKIYRDASPSHRNLKKLVTRYFPSGDENLHRRLVSRWRRLSRLHRWEDRVRAWDRFQDRQERLAATEERREMLSRHARMGIFAQGRALQRISQMNLAMMEARDAIELLSLGIQMERDARGEIPADAGDTDLTREDYTEEDLLAMAAQMELFSDLRLNSPASAALPAGIGGEVIEGAMLDPDEADAILGGADED